MIIASSTKTVDWILTMAFSSYAVKVSDVDAEIHQQLSEFHSMGWHRWHITVTAGLRTQCKTLTDSGSELNLHVWRKQWVLRSVFPQDTIKIVLQQKNTWKNIIANKMCCRNGSGANRRPVCDSAVGCWNYIVLILYRPFGANDLTAQVLCFSYKDSLSLLSSLVAKQWLFLQNWNPIPAHQWLPTSPLTISNGQIRYSLRVGSK